MTFLKILSSAIATVVVALVITLIFVRLGAGNDRAIGVEVLKAVTIYSAVYWLVVIVSLGVLWWFLGHWLFAGRVHR